MEAQSDTTSITIRHANLADVDELFRLLPQLTAHADSPQAQMPNYDEARQHISTLIANELVYFFVAISPDQRQQTAKIVGTLILLIVPNLTHGGRAWAQIENVVVERTVRRHGIGRKLVTAAIAHAQEQGCYKVQLISGTKPEQLAFYRAIGFGTTNCTGHKLYLV